MSNLTGADDQAHPQALPAVEDREAAFAAAIQQGQAEFDHVRELLAQAPHQLDDVAGLAAVLATLPPGMGFRVGVTQIVGAGTHPDDWINTVVPSIITLIGPAEPPLHDGAGRECYVPVPALELTEWLLPDGDATAGEPHAADPYQRLREACDKEGPADILTAASKAMATIGTLLGNPMEGPLGFLPDDSEAGEAIRDAIDQIAAMAAALTVLATQTQAEDDARTSSAQ